MSVCRVFRLTSVESLEEVSCLMMSDTGLYLNWMPNTLIADVDEQEVEPTMEDDTLLGGWDTFFRALSCRFPRITLCFRVCKRQYDCGTKYRCVLFLILKKLDR